MDYKLKFENYINENYNDQYLLIHIPEMCKSITKVKIRCAIHNTDFMISWHKFRVGQTGCKECKQDKKKTTCMKRYGVENPAQFPEFNDKKKETCLKKYGVECSLLSTKIQKKIISTCIKKYGVDHYSKTNMFSTKVSSTCMKRYGVKNPAQVDIFKQKSKNTCVEKYGVNFFLQTDIAIYKSKQTCLNKYNVYHYKQRHIDLYHIEILNNKEKLQKLLDIKSLIEIANDFNVVPTTVGYYAKKHNIPVFNSTIETSIATFLTEHNISYIANSKSIIKPVQLDFYIPEHNLAIEYGGSYWHAENKRERITVDYHKMKYDRCKELGITLITIFGDEWNEDTRNKILYHLGLSNNSWIPEEREVIADLRFGEDKFWKIWDILNSKNINPQY